MSRTDTTTAPLDRLLAGEPSAVRARLHDLAALVAAELERGEVAAAWARTRVLERTVDPVGAGVGSEPAPPAPVVGRRFALAHRRVLDGLDAPAEALDPCRHPAA